MVSVDAFTQTLIGFIQTYGCLALFVLIVLETAWIIHFAPSEVIIPFARMNLRRFTVYSFGG